MTVRVFGQGENGFATTRFQVYALSAKLDAIKKSMPSPKVATAAAALDN